METKEIKINVPEGYVIDQENSTFECIKFKPAKKEFPKTWKEFCETHPRKVGEAYLGPDCTCHVVRASAGMPRDPKHDKNILPSEDLVEAMLALCQLIQLRDCYNDDWKPVWVDNLQEKYCIYNSDNTIQVDMFIHANAILAFKTKGICDRFLMNFQDLIETAKPLL